MIYLASPYSDQSPAIRNARYVQAASVARQLIRLGHVVFSPIAYSHQMADELGGDFESWQKFDLEMIDVADEVWVLTLNGWKESIGVAAEIEHARRIGTSVFLIDQLTLKRISHERNGEWRISEPEKGHPWDRDSRWEQITVTATTEPALNEAVANQCLAGWSCWISGLLDTPNIGKQFAAVMYRAKEIGSGTETRKAATT